MSRSLRTHFLPIDAAAQSGLAHYSDRKSLAFPRSYGSFAEAHFPQFDAVAAACSLRSSRLTWALRGGPATFRRTHRRWRPSGGGWPARRSRTPRQWPRGGGGLPEQRGRCWRPRLKRGVRTRGREQQRATCEQKANRCQEQRANDKDSVKGVISSGFSQHMLSWSTHLQMNIAPPLFLKT